MLCRTCYGQHWVIRSGQMAPCPECGGLGEVHCCDGLASQAGCAEGPAVEVACGAEAPRMMACRSYPPGD